jgi:diguanylate cyclase (GGDEF)-like protein/PAS domain S-box-containing protein
MIKSTKKTHYSIVLTLTIVAIVLLSVGLISFISFLNEKKAIEDLSNQIHNEVNIHVKTQINDYLQVPQKINEINFNFIKLNHFSFNANDLNEYFLSEFNQYPNIMAISYGDEQGNYIGPQRSLDSSGKYYSVQAISNGQTNYILTYDKLDDVGNIIGFDSKINSKYDPRVRPWYIAAKEAGHPAWTPVYTWADGKTVGLDAVTPVYDQNKKLMGVLLTAYTIPQISEILNNTKVSKNGQIFIVDNTGQIIAASSIKEPFIKTGNDIKLLSSIDCKNPIISSVSSYIKKKYGGFGNIKSDLPFQLSVSNANQFVKILPLSDNYGLDWKVVTVVPESDIMGQINADYKLNALILILALFIIIVFSILIAKRVTKPILKLNQSAKELAQGNWDIEVDNRRNDEIGELANSFNHMTEQLKTTFEALTTSENKFRLLAENSNDMITLLNLDGICTYVSPSSKKITGYEFEEIIGRNIFEKIHPDDIMLIKNTQVKLSKSKNDSHMVSFRYKKKDDTYIWVETNLKIMYDKNTNKLIEIQAITRDISERKNFEAELQKTINEIQDLYNNAPCGYHSVDKDAYFVRINNTELEWLGYTREELIGRMKITDILTAKTHQSFNENFKGLIEKGFVNNLDYDFIAKDGKIISVLVNSSSIYDKDGNFLYSRTTSYDITKKKQREQIIFEEREQLKVTLQSIGDGVITTDNHGNITMINWVSEELTGWDNNSAVGKPLSEVFDIFNEMTGEKCINPVEKVLETKTIVELANHTVLKSRDGTIRAIADTAAPILNKEKMVIGIVLVFRDVSEVNARQKEIMYLSCHDTLTDLYNRNYFEKEIKRLEEKTDYPISIIMGDVNGLKLTNDIFGHSDGDKVLKTIADILSKCCRPQDIVARWGGDEFCILLPSTNKNIAKDICNRITRICEETHIYIGSGYSAVSISLGYTTKEDETENLDDILRLAESSMYKRKLLDSKSMQNSLIASIKATLFEKSIETEEHANRLIENSRAIGQLINLSEDQMNDLELLAMLHDIGKIAIDDSIISKDEGLTEEEWAEIRRHPEIGFRIAQASPELIHIAQSILSHHERWDGNGYPRGLKEKEIPLLSRIIAIADAYDAMTNDRVYRKAMSKEEAIKEIKINSGTQFDPEIANEFLGYILKCED